MSDKNKVYYSKVLLFGEYSILLNSNGLSIPYSHFNGQLNSINKNGYTDLSFAKESNKHLQLYAEYLETNTSDIIDSTKLIKDVEKGLYFESTIPEGYGLGSSGALVAAIYEGYGKNKIKPKRKLTNSETQKLKAIFSRLESYFHGKSSGIDPLICYLKHPLFIENQENISPIDISRKNIQSDDAVFIVDTHQVGKTAPLVDLFMSKCNEPQFEQLIKQELIPTTNQCIHSLLNGQLNDFFEKVKQLSKFQFEHFKEMIPHHFSDLWKEGLNNNQYLLKLCGSGGGGYLLGFTRHFTEVKQNLAKQGLEIIPVYQEL